MTYFANTLRHLGQLDRAADIQQQVLSTLQQSSEEDYLDTIKAMSDLAATLTSRGQHKAAEVMLQQILLEKQ